MNKVHYTRISNTVFQFDEDAYRLLKRVLDGYKAGFKYSTKTYEKLEQKVANFLLELKANQENFVISINDVEMVRDHLNEIISEGTGQFGKTQPISKKLFRDTDDKVIGGVVSGLSHYFDVDTVLLRIIALILVLLSTGTSVLVYLILWILVRKPRTPIDRARMYGYPFDSKDFTEKTRENFKKASERMSAVSFGYFFGNIRDSFQKFFQRFQRTKSTSRL